MGGGAIVALEPDDLSAWEVGLEAEDVVDLGPAPAIDRLVVIADAADVAGSSSEQPEPQILDDVGVLIFVDQHKLKARLILRKHVRVILEQPQILKQEIPEIRGVQLLQPVLIGGIKLAALPVGEGKALPIRNPFRAKTSVLPAVDHGGEETRRPPLLVDVLGLEQLLQKPDLVIGVENCEGRLEVYKLGMAAQDLDANGVEGAEPGHALDHPADQLADAPLHLPRRLVGEGHGEDLP